MSAAKTRLRKELKDLGSNRYSPRIVPVYAKSLPSGAPDTPKADQRGQTNEEGWTINAMYSVALRPRLVEVGLPQTWLLTTFA